MKTLIVYENLAHKFLISIVMTDFLILGSFLLLLVYFQNILLQFT